MAKEGSTICPRCGNSATSMVPVDAGTRLILQSKKETNVPKEVCQACHEDLSQSASKGAQLMAGQKARQQNKVMLWKNRVNLIKRARQLMEAKAYSEAAVSYEKYLKVLEMVYDLKPGELNPGVFNNSSRSKEMTVVTSVYWDLFRIYDTSPRYGDRMRSAGKKLALFLPFSSIMPDISTKAVAFGRSAKNSGTVKVLLKDINANRVRCFVASAVFETPMAVEVQILQQFRDHYLKTNRLGRRFVCYYYKKSPRWVKFLDRHSWLKPPVRYLLQLFTQQLAKLDLKRKRRS